MSKHGHAVLVLLALLVVQGCRREPLPEPEAVREMPAIVLRAQEWMREHEALSRGQELGTLDFLWENYALDSNSLGQEIVSVPVRNPADAGGGYMELAFGVDDAGEPRGMVKHYIGDMSEESVNLCLYAGTGHRAMAGTYYPATGKFSPRAARGGIVKIAKAPSKKDADVDYDALIDGGTIDEVYVTAKGFSSGGGSFGHWGSPGWGSFGGGGGSGGGFGSPSNPILIEPVYVSARRNSNGFVFPLLPFLLDDGSVVQSTPYHIRVNFASGSEAFSNRVKSVLIAIKNGKFGNADHGCFAAGVLRAVRDKQGGTHLNIRLKEKPFGPNGAYNPTTRTMEYIYADYVDPMSTFHEILHYYQDLSGHYPNMRNMGIAPYGKASRGFANIEFEVRLILDIMKGYGDEYVYELKESGLLSLHEMGSINEDYKKFVNSFRGADKKLLHPDTMDRAKFRVDYDRFLDLYATKSKNYRSEVDKNLDPKVLFELLKSVFDNCK